MLSVTWKLLMMTFYASVQYEKANIFYELIGRALVDMCIRSY